MRAAAGGSDYGSTADGHDRSKRGASGAGAGIGTPGAHTRRVFGELAGRLALSRFHDLLAWMAAFLGVDSAPLALLMIVFSVFLMVFFRFSVVLSHLKDHNIALAQRVAILEFHLRSLHEKEPNR
jgi:hypothetical protein